MVVHATRTGRHHADKNLVQRKLSKHHGEPSEASGTKLARKVVPVSVSRVYKVPILVLSGNVNFLESGKKYKHY